MKETRPLWPPQRGVGLREPNLGKTNPRVTLFICLRFVFHPLSRTRFHISNANPACSCVYICKFQFRPIHPPSRRLSDRTRLTTLLPLPVVLLKIIAFLPSIAWAHSTTCQSVLTSSAHRSCFDKPISQCLPRKQLQKPPPPWTTRQGSPRRK